MFDYYDAGFPIGVDVGSMRGEITVLNSQKVLV